MTDPRRTLLALVLCWPLAAVAAEKSGRPAGPEAPAPPPDTVGAKAPEATTPAPVKSVEEPVFQLPELVIIGENRARIMAQKEALAGSPLRGLHEAPLLEKEESSVTALRRREPAAITHPTRTGTGLAVKLEGGTKGWLGGGLWAGRQTDHSAVGLDLDGSTLRGEPAGPAGSGGRAGGFETGAAVSGGWTGTPPAWLSFLSLGADPDLVHAGAGWRESWRDLPWNAAKADTARRLTRVWAAGDESRAGTGWSGEQRLEIVHLRTPVRSVGAAGLAGTGSVHVWERGSLAVRFVGRAEAEFADASGDHFLAGGTLEGSWVPATRWRAQAGLRTEGVFGGRVFAGSLRPVGGVAWTSPPGPEVTAVFAPSLRAPWLSRDAVESPYSVFGARLVPMRELANLEVGARQGWWRGDEIRVAWRMTATRDARSWGLIPSLGLFAPVALPGLRVHEFLASGRWAGLKPLTLFAAASARAITATGGAMANLPRGEATAGAEYAWNALTAGLNVEVRAKRPRSAVASAGTLRGFAAVGVSLGWRPAARFEVRLRADNLGGADIERWAGYPEPRRLVSLGVLAAF
ncbi:MAG: TonB-dependent receptor [Candidatus Coatesbacteria bacterium]